MTCIWSYANAHISSGLSPRFTNNFTYMNKDYYDINILT